MKKLTAVLLVCCFVLCGCSKKAPAPESTPEPTEPTEITTAAVTETAAETTEAPTEPPAQDTETAYWHHPDLSLEEALSCYLEPDTVGQYYSMRLPSSAEEAWLYEMYSFDVKLFYDIYRNELPLLYEDEINSYFTEQFGMTKDEFLYETEPEQADELVQKWADSVDPHTLTDWQYLFYYDQYMCRIMEAKEQEADRLREIPVQEMSAGDLFGFTVVGSLIYPDMTNQASMETFAPQLAERCREILAQPEYAEKVPEYLAKNGIGSDDAAIPQTRELDAANTAAWYAAYTKDLQEDLVRENRTDHYIPETLEQVMAKLLLNRESYYYDADFPSCWEMPDDLPYLPEVSEVRYIVVDRPDDEDKMPKLLQNEELFACYVPGDGWLFHKFNDHNDSHFDPASNSEKRTALQFMYAALGALGDLGVSGQPGCYSSEPECSVNPSADFDNTAFVNSIRKEFPALDDYRYIIVVNENSAHVAIQRKNAALTPCIGFAWRDDDVAHESYSECYTDATFLLPDADSYWRADLAHALDFEAVCDALMENYGFLF